MNILVKLRELIGHRMDDLQERMDEAGQPQLAWTAEERIFLRSLLIEIESYERSEHMMEVRCENHGVSCGAAGNYYTCIPVAHCRKCNGPCLLNTLRE